MKLFLIEPILWVVMGTLSESDTIEYSQDMFCQYLFFKPISKLLLSGPTVLPAKSDSDVMFCLQSF